MRRKRIFFPDQLNPRTLWLRSLWACLGTRAIGSIILFLTSRLSLDDNRPFSQLILNLTVRWDAQAYLRVAQFGTPEGSNDLGLFPLYPWLIRAFTFVTGHYVVSALLISFVAQWIAGYYLQVLAKKYVEAEDNPKVLLLFSIFPTAYFLMLPYTESLFLVFALGTFFFSEQKKWYWASVCASLGGITRMQGLALIPALFVEMYFNAPKWKERAWFLLAPLGFLSYLGYNWYFSGEPLYFLTIQKKFFFVETTWPFVPWFKALFGFFRDSASQYKTSYIDTPALFLLGSMILLAAGFRYLRKSHQIYGWAYIFLLSLNSWGVSNPRYVLPLFPQFFVLARLSKEPTVKYMIFFLFTSLWTFYLCFYFLNKWAF